MSLPPPTPPSRSLQILGLIAGVSLAAGATNMVANALLPIQFLGGGAIFNLIAPMLTGFLINLGIAILIFTLITGALLEARLEARL